MNMRMGLSQSRSANFEGKETQFLPLWGTEFSFPGYQNRGVFTMLTELSLLHFRSLSRIIRMIRKEGEIDEQADGAHGTDGKCLQHLGWIN